MIGRSCAGSGWMRNCVRSSLAIVTTALASQSQNLTLREFVMKRHYMALARLRLGRRPTSSIISLHSRMENMHLRNVRIMKLTF